MWFLVAISAKTEDVAVPEASAAASSSKKPTIAAGVKRLSFLPGPSEDTLNVCGRSRGT